MRHVIDEATGLPLSFPDQREEAFARAQEFSRLLPHERWQEIAALMEWGLKLVRCSPRREIIEQRWQEQEAEWQDLQQRLFARYAK